MGSIKSLKNNVDGSECDLTTTSERWGVLEGTLKMQSTFGWNKVFFVLLKWKNLIKKSTTTLQQYRYCFIVTLTHSVKMCPFTLMSSSIFQHSMESTLSCNFRSHRQISLLIVNKFNPFMHFKIFKVCLAILKHYAWKV